MPEDRHLQRPLRVSPDHPRDYAPLLERFAVLPDRLAGPRAALRVVKISGLHDGLRRGFPAIGVCRQRRKHTLNAIHVDGVLVRRERLSVASGIGFWNLSPVCDTVRPVVRLHGYLTS